MADQVPQVPRSAASEGSAPDEDHERNFSSLGKLTTTEPTNTTPNPSQYERTLLLTFYDLLSLLHAVPRLTAEYIDHSKHDPEKVVEVSSNNRYAKVRGRTCPI